MKFNYKYTEYNKLPHNGDNLQLRNIQDIQEISQTKIDRYTNFCQIINCGYRMGEGDVDYNLWNGCTWEDIDYKKCLDNFNIDPNEIYDTIWNYLLKHYNNITYYSELSRSQKGFHFLFYFNTPRTKNCFLMCKSISICIIKEAFINCGYKDIIEWNEVYDDCSFTLYQPIFITKIKYNINNCSGECSEIAKADYQRYSLQYDKLIHKESQKENIKAYNNNNDYEYENVSIEDTDEEVEYINHHMRYILFMSLSKLCGEDEDKLIDMWKICARRIPEENGHTTDYYINVPWKLDWARNRFDKADEVIVNRSLLEKFNIKYTYRKHEKDKNKFKRSKVKIFI